MRPARLEQVLDRSQICELLSALLSSEGCSGRHMALTLVHVHMTKAPEAMRPLLMREGIVHQIQNMAKAYENGGKSVCGGAGDTWGGGEVSQAALEGMVKFVCTTHLPKSREAGDYPYGLTPVRCVSILHC